MMNRNPSDRMPLLLLMVAVEIMMVGVVWCDYPPPSEDNQGYYSNKQQASEVVGGEGGYQSDWNNHDWSSAGNPNPGKCVDIPSNLTLCRDIGYSEMRLPNLLEHDTLKEVSQQASSWVRLLAVHCHPDTQVFLCSLFAPVCLNQPIWPCRPLCEAVRAGCEDRMLKYGFPWPEMLRCDQYPNDEELCIGLRSDSDRGGRPSCSSCLSDTFESTVDHYCRADFAMRIKVKQAKVTESDMKIDTEKKKKIFKTGSLKSSEIRDASLYVANGSSCECSALDNIKAGGAKDGLNFIVMGNMVDDRLVLSYVHRIGNGSKEVHRAMRAVRKPQICTQTESLKTKNGIAGGLAPPNTRKGNDSRKGPGKKSKTSGVGNGRRQSATPPSESGRTTIRLKATTPAAAAAIVKKTQHSDRQKKKQQKPKSTAVTPLFY